MTKEEFFKQADDVRALIRQRIERVKRREEVFGTERELRHFLEELANAEDCVRRGVYPPNHGLYSAKHVMDQWPFDDPIFSAIVQLDGAYRGMVS